MFSYVCLLVAFLLSTLPLASSLWLDETATWWVVKDGIREVFARSWDWSGQSALYYLTAWVSRHLAPFIGLEPALRLPSLLAMALGSVLLYRLGRRLISPPAGMLSALAFLCLTDVSSAAIDARPYALALALVIASMFCFIQWLDSGRAWHAILYVLTSTLVIYAHYLFALALVPQLAYGLRRNRRLAVLWLGIGALCLPLAGQVLHFYRTGQSHSFAGTPFVQDFFTAIAPPFLAGTVLVAMLLSRPAPALNLRCAPLLAGWLLFPPAFLFFVSLFTSVKLFVPRYYLGCAPAAALLAGYAITRSSAIRAASTILILALMLGVWQGGSVHGHQDWRGAAQCVNARVVPGDIVLATSGFVEGTRQAIDGPFRDVLYAPQSAYPIRQMFRVPYLFDEKAMPPDLLRSRQVFLVSLSLTVDAQQASLQYKSWLTSRLSGYRMQSLGYFGSVSVTVFSRMP